MSILVIGNVKYERVYELNENLSKNKNMLASSHSIHPGGHALYQSIAASKAGAEVYISTILGNDAASLKTTLILNKINCSDIITVDAASGHTVIIKDSAGDKIICTYDGRKLYLSEDNIRSSLVNHQDNCDYCLIASDMKFSSFAVDEAHTLRYKIVFSPNFSSDANVPDLSKVDYCIISIDELSRLLGLNNLSQDKNKLKKYLDELVSKYKINKLLLVLENKQGLISYDGLSYTSISINDQFNLIDDTGSEDCLAAYFTVLISEGKSFEEAACSALLATCLSLSRSGGAVVSPLRAEVNEKIRELNENNLINIQKI